MVDFINTSEGRDTKELHGLVAHDSGVKGLEQSLLHPSSMEIRTFSP
jgi:hypothetical protein